jgi:hypothetical protein
MSATTKNLATAPHHMPPLAGECIILRGSRRARVLGALHASGNTPMSSRQLAQLLGARRGVTVFWREVLQPLHECGYVDQLEWGGAGDCWRITRKGLDACPDLGLVPAPPDSTVAQPLVTIGTGPLPPDTYRCPRPGAYDYERHPSRHGNRRHYRDGRVELVTD